MHNCLEGGLSMQYVNHRCRKFLTFWERVETLRNFLSELQLFEVSRSKKRLNIAENILNMEKFD
jgi:hypothetical protein